MILGRADDLIIRRRAQHRHPPRSRARSSPTIAVAEAAVIGKPDPLKGNVIKAFVTSAWG